MTALTRAALAAYDAADPLRAKRDEFFLPEGVIYLDGNSLGPLPRAVPARVQKALTEEWGTGLIRSWLRAKWMELPARIGAKIAPLIGAKADEVICCDSTSVNIFKVVTAALRLNPGRRVIVSQKSNFPTDLYVAQGATALMDKGHVINMVDGDDVLAAIDDKTALVMLTHVDFKTGRIHDMAAVTKRAHEMGALVMWDLAHSAGGVPTDLNGANADFAVGCGYKYLNGGPGAPAFIYVRKDLQEKVQPGLAGWIGHARPFDFVTQYEPGAGMHRALVGTPPILGMTALDTAMDVWQGVNFADVRAKSLKMGDVFIELVESRCAGHGLRLITPLDEKIRGSQASFAHPESYAIMQELIARGVIGDFRAPDAMRFGFTPLYLSYVDLWDAVEILRDILHTRAWDKAEYKVRAAVT
jgi:kynureninase